MGSRYWLLAGLAAEIVGVFLLGFANIVDVKRVFGTLSEMADPDILVEKCYRNRVRVFSFMASGFSFLLWAAVGFGVFSMPMYFFVAILPGILAAAGLSVAASETVASGLFALSLPISIPLIFGGAVAVAGWLPRRLLHYLSTDADRKLGRIGFLFVLAGVLLQGVGLLLF